MTLKKTFYILIVLLTAMILWKVVNPEIPNRATTATQILPNSAITSLNVIGELSTTTGIFLGNYVSLKKPFGEEGKTETCDVFVAQKSADPLFVYFSNLVKEGNSVNAIDSEGNLLLNIDLDRVATATKEKIIESTKERPLNIKVRKEVLSGKGAQPCSSFIAILSL